MIATHKGKTSIGGLGSITATRTGDTETNKNAYGIYSKNTNDVSESATFSVAFAGAGGTINSYSAKGMSYGIQVDSDSTGTSSITNVKTITAGVDPSSASTYSTGAAAGIITRGGTNTVSFTGKDSSITAASSGNSAYGISMEKTGTTTITDLGSITATRTGDTGDDKNAYGILSTNWNTASQSGQPATFAVTFDSTNGGTIHSYSAYGESYGIRFVSGSTGTSSITKVNSIMAGYIPASGQIPEVVGSGTKSQADGIYVGAGSNTVSFTGSSSSIIAKSEKAYGIYFTSPEGNAQSTEISELGSIVSTSGESGATGIFSRNKSNPAKETFSVTFAGDGGSIDVASESNSGYGIWFGSLSTGISSIANVKTITARGVTTTYGIQAEVGVNTVSFSGTNSSITAKSSGSSAYGIAFGNTSAKGTATGTTTISGLGSIVTTSGNSYPYGIYSKNGNEATAVSNPTFSVAFAEAGGTINSYAANYYNYGILFDTGSSGTSSITNVKSITAGINPDSPEVFSTQGAGGIVSKGGKNTVNFVSGGSITVKTSTSYGTNGIINEGGTLTVSNLASLESKSTNTTDAWVFGINAGESSKNEISFKGNGGQAITVEGVNPNQAISINTYGTSETTVNFENCILSGNISQSSNSVLTLNFNDKGIWEPKSTDTVTGTVTVNIKDGGVAKFETGPLELEAAGTTLTFAGNSTIVLGKDVSVKKIEGTAGAFVWKSGSLTPSEGALSAGTLAVIGSGKTLSTPISGVTNYLFAVDSAATSPQKSMLSVAGDVTLGTNDMVGVTLAKGAKFKKDDTIKLISVTSGSLQDSRNDKSNLATTIQSNLADNNTAATQAIAANTEASNKVNRYTFGISQVSNDLLATVTKVAASNVTKAVRQVNDSTVISFRSQMNDVSRRMGELRGNPEGYGAWARVYGGQTTMGEGMKEKSVTLQVGGDKWFSSNFYAGMMAAYTKADDTLANGDNDQKNWNIGLYGGYFGEDGRFWDATVKFGRFGNDFNLMHEDSEVSHAKYHTWGQSFSLEGGWRLQCPSTNFYVEPQAEIMYGHLNGVSFTDNLGITTSQKKVDTFVGRLGVAAGYNFADDKGTAYVKASILHDSQGKVESECRIDGEVDQDAGKSRDLGGTWGEFALGGTFKATKNLNLYGELMCTTKAAGVRTKWQGSAGVRYTF